MIVAFFAWLLTTGAVIFGTHTLTGGNRFYTAVFALITLFAPPIGLTAFVIFFSLRPMMPAAASLGTGRIDEDGGSVPSSLQLTQQLKAAKALLEKELRLLQDLESKLGRIDPKNPGDRKKMEAMEKEKAVRTMQKIAAESAYERLLKQHS